MRVNRLRGILLVSIRTATGEMCRRKLRTALSVAMLAIGTISIVLSVGIVRGILVASSEYIKATGGLELVRVFETALVQQDPGAQYWRSLSLADAARIRSKLEQRATVAPEVGFPSGPVFRPGREAINSYVVGGDSEYCVVNRTELERGRGISPVDILRRTRVIVISQEVRTRLFKESEDPIGKVVMFAGNQFRVIGVFKEYDYYTGPVKNSRQFKNRFSQIPLSVAQEIGYGPGEQISGIHVSLKSYRDLEWAKKMIRIALLVGREGIQDFQIETREREAAGWRATERAATLAAFLLAVVALIIACLSTTALMLTSLSERKREIGIRRACGAGADDIVFQFLLESCLIGLIGGALGIILGYCLIPVVGNLMPDSLPGKPVFVMSIALTGAVFSISAGFIAGILPAVRARRLPPLEAIRSL